MNSASTPLISIIIVNYNEEQFLVPLLESFRKFESSLSKEIFILDNHSITDIPSLLRDRFPEVTILPQKGNEGFGRTNNAGLRMANGKYVLLLNPDTLLRSNCISACVQYFESHINEKIGAIGCRLQSTDGSYQKSFFHLAASMKKTWQLNPVYIKIFGNRITTQMQQLDQSMYEKISDAPWLCGAFLLMRRETINNNHFFFDEDFFLYSEDCELGHRMRKKGYRLIYFPDEAILHLGSGSMPYITRFEQLTISEWLSTMKIHGKLYFLFNQLLLLSNIILDQLFFCKSILVNPLTFRDKREKIIRRRLSKLLSHYTLTILFNYHRKPSSAKAMLKFL